MASLSLYTKLEALPSELKEEAILFIEKLLNKNKERAPESKKKLEKREFGCLKGKIHLSDDFDAPLDDFKEYM